MEPEQLPAHVREPLDRWLDAVQTGRFPMSVRRFAPELHEELCRVVADGSPSVEELGQSWRSESGADARGRSLRTLDRLGFLEQALEAVTEARSRLES